MDITELKPFVEALIFASEEPLGLAGLTGILEEKGATKGEIEQTLAVLMQDYNENSSRGLLLREVGGGYQFVTKPELAGVVQKLNVEKPKTLSQASLETLAIVAYRQPVVRSEIEQIRGVDSGGVLKTLLERGFIRIVGRKEEAGQPLIYGTTPAFLELFHLTNLEELPSMKEVEQIVEEQNRPQIEPEEERMVEEEIIASLSEGEALAEDQVIQELESSLKTLRKLEKDIFPQEKKPEESSEATPAAEEKIEN